MSRPNECAGCGSPADKPPAGPCPGHPLSEEQRLAISHAYLSGLQHGEESAESRMQDAINRGFAHTFATARV